jgi:cell division protein FtsL
MTGSTVDRYGEQHAEWEHPPGRRTVWLAVLLIVALAITLAGIFPFRQMIAQHRQVATAEAQLIALSAENARLEDEITALSTPAEIERIAREQLGLVRPGETSYIVEAPPEREGSEPVTAEEGAAADARSPFEKVWDFLTGRDLAPDG